MTMTEDFCQEFRTGAWALNNSTRCAHVRVTGQGILLENEAKKFWDKKTSLFIPFDLILAVETTSNQADQHTRSSIPFLDLDFPLLGRAKNGQKVFDRSIEVISFLFKIRKRTKINASPQTMPCKKS